MSKIKICGLFRECDIEYVNEARPDYAGFVFANSKRRVNEEEALKLKKILSEDIKTVGVFVDEEIEKIIRLCEKRTIDLIQLHGNEDELYINKLKKLTDKPIIKAVRVQNREQISEAEKLPVQYLLLDTFEKNVMGGTGKAFDWGLIGKVNKPYFLAGGISIENVETAVETGAYCIDVSSGVETEGVKDKQKILEIVRGVRL